MWINLKEIENLKDNEKIEQFENLRLHCLFLEWEFWKSSKLQADFSKQVKEEVNKQNKKNVAFFWQADVKKYYEDIIKDLRKDRDMARANPRLDELNMRRKIINEMAVEKKKENPLLLPSVRKSREKLYPYILTNPWASMTEIKKWTWASQAVIKAAMNELIVDWKLIIEKIDFIKEIVAAHAVLMKWSQLRLIERLQSDEEMKNMTTNELVNIMKTAWAWYSLLVWQTTDKNGWLLKEQDEKLLDEVLWKHLEEVKEENNI